MDLPRSAPAILLCVADQTIELGVGRHLIGRTEDASVLLSDASVSRRHAVLAVAPDGITLEDLASSNGTYVEDVPVSHAVAVGAGANLRFGSVYAKLLDGSRVWPRQLSARTSPEVPHALSDDEEVPTQQNLSLDLLQTNVRAALAHGLVDDACRLFDTSIDLLRPTLRRLNLDVVDSLAGLAGDLAAVSSNGKYLDQLLELHRVRGVPLSGTRLDELEEQARRGLRPSRARVEAYASTLDSLGGDPALISRLRALT
ncbi:MAG: FHA domain-containing protein [Polyangiaceae bacterium]